MMKRFILLTFGFLGWAFYEMSGGADFESASDRMARLSPAVVEEPLPATEPVAVAQTESTPAFVDTDPPEESSVTRVALNLTTLQDALDSTQADQPAPQAEIVNVDPETGVAINAGLSTSSADTPAIIPSLIVPQDSGASTSATTLTSVAGTDIRTVTGNRVNVRGGPGTDFGVVNKLVRGDAVEILEDDGNGWVRMRPLDGGTEGWMADFLLVSG